MSGWTGPHASDWADSSETVLRAPVPPERFPFCWPEEHEICCTLRGGGLYCDCSASAVDETPSQVWQIPPPRP